jgi:hypothetical protein
MSIDEVLDMLKRFKDSPIRKEKVWKESLNSEVNNSSNIKKKKE